MRVGQLGVNRMQLTPSGCRFIVRGIPQGQMVGGISLIWGIPAKTSPYFHGQGSGIKMGLRKFYSCWLERLGDARFVVGGAA